MADDARYGQQPRRRRSDDEWRQYARAVLLDILDHHYAITTSELEARAADRVWDPHVCPDAINPHHLGNARSELQRDGVIVPTAAVTRGQGDALTTWSREPVRGLRRKIEDAAARKRLLTARHNGWANRGGRGRGLIGSAGELALHGALTHPTSPLTKVSGSTTNVLGVSTGEVDNFAYFVDDTERTAPSLIAVMFEVKNTRQWYYENDADVLKYLGKAALVQHAHPTQLLLPVFVCRRLQYTLWRQGERDGFLPAYVEHQLVLDDHDLDREQFDEVRTELGFEDLRLSTAPTNRHLGIVRTSIPKNALQYARTWQARYRAYLPAQPSTWSTDDLI